MSISSEGHMVSKVGDSLGDINAMIEKTSSFKTETKSGRYTSYVESLPERASKSSLEAAATVTRPSFGVEHNLFQN